MNARILIVEDDPSLRTTLRQHVEEQGLKPLAVESGEAALAQFAAFRPHAVLLDVHLPGMSGLELLLKLRESAPEVPVILVTGDAGVTSVVDAMKWGAFDYLLKPLDLDAIDRALGRCLRLCRARRPEPDTEATPAQDTGNGNEPILVGTAPKMVEVYKLIGQVSSVPTPVLVRGETGTGKEVTARLIHANSAFADGPFLAVNCAALPETLLESELFGHTRGAFTGAVAERKGRFELAGRGTIFLDEIGDISPAVQVKLLRVLQDGEFQPLGSERSTRTDGRVIAATHRPLEQLVAEGKFREDLYFRLRVVEIVVPPLRERRDDIPGLVSHILTRQCRRMNRAVPIVPERVMELLRGHEWPGNVRELENALTRAAVLARGVIEPEHLSLGFVAPALGFVAPAAAARQQEAPAGADASLGAVERQYVRRVLLKAGGSKTKAAAMLGISRPRLNRLLGKHGVPVS
jgi:DNA-binding NtrC family response regulator